MPNLWDIESEALTEHLRRDVRLWLGLRADIEDVPLPPSALIRRLLRVEEYEQAHRDQWDCFEYGFCESYREGRLWIPELDEWAAARRRELRVQHELEPLWPAGKRFVVCPTHDVDMIGRKMTPAQFTRGVRNAFTAAAANGRRPSPARLEESLRAVSRGAYYGLAAAPETSGSLEQCMAIEQQIGTAGTYLFTVLPHRRTVYDCVYDFDDKCTFRGRSRTVRALVQTLHDEGFDVGLHGSWSSAIDETVLASERERLSDAVGTDITVTRQHYLHFDMRRTPGIQARSGLRVDSTLGFNRNVGFRAGTSLPFHHFDLSSQKTVDVLEIPLSMQDGSLFGRNALELDHEMARRTIISFTDAIAEVGGVLTLLFHPHSLIAKDVRDLYRFALEYGAGAGGWLASLDSIDRWWRERERRILAAKEG